MAARYVVAADGGNSKTDVVLATVAGDVLARVSGPGTRPHLDGLDVTADGLADLTRAAVAQAGLATATSVTAASYLLANVDFPDEERAMHAALTARRVAERIEVGNDTLAVLRAGSRTGWGIAVVSGAGINAVGRHPDGRLERFLGIGSLSGDWGGGWGIAVAGIAAAVRAGDGRGEPTVLRELVVETFGLDAEAAAVAAHRGEITERRIFDFAPAVFGAATAGDRVAVALVSRLADEVVSYVEALAGRLDVTGSEVEVVLGGAALQSANPVLMTRIHAGIAAAAPAARIRVLDVPPVAGALVTALALGGAPPAGVERARTSLRTGATAPAPAP